MEGREKEGWVSIAEKYVECAAHKPVVWLGRFLEEVVLDALLAHLSDTCGCEILWHPVTQEQLRGKKSVVMVAYADQPGVLAGEALAMASSATRTGTVLVIVERNADPLPWAKEAKKCTDGVFIFEYRKDVLARLARR